jgi:hypothetical protein
MRNAQSLKFRSGKFWRAIKLSVKETYFRELNEMAVT